MRKTRLAPRLTAILAAFLSLLTTLGVTRATALADGAAINVTLSYQADDSGFRLARRAVPVEPGLSEQYGYIDAYYGTEPTALDAIVAAHGELFGDSLTDNLAVRADGWITNFMGSGGGDFVYFVNGSYMGASAGYVTLSDGDVVELFSMQDTEWYTDAYAWFEYDGDRAGEITVGAEVSFDLTLTGVDFVIFGEDGGAFQTEIDGALIVALELDGYGGAWIDTPLGVTDDEGFVEVSFEAPGTYLLSAIDYDSMMEIPLMSPWLAVTVDESASAPAVTSRGFVNPAPAPSMPGKATVDAYTAFNNTLRYLAQTQAPAPSFGDEWEVLTLARAGYAVPGGYYEGYAESVAAAVKAIGSARLDTYSTTNARVVLALTAIGADAESVMRYNLLEPLEDYGYVTGQGLNGAIYALLAFDSKPYEVSQAARDAYVSYILSCELPGGGFTGWGDDPEPDATGMALQALAPYAGRSDVSAVISRALAALSAAQEYNGGYVSWGAVSAENMAQVVTAATALGYDPSAGSDFVKGGGDAVSSLLRFYVDGGGFQSAWTPGAVNRMSTQQAAYALSAYVRFQSGRNALYDMRDAVQRVPAAAMVDFGALNEAIASAETKSGSAYTPDSWSAMTGKLDAARDALNDPNSTQSIADNAAAALKAAVDALRSAGSGSDSSSEDAGGAKPEETPPVPVASPPKAEIPPEKPAPDAAQVNPFRDVTTGDQYYGAVLAARTRGFMTGFAADEFAPTAVMTRAMAASALFRLAGQPKHRAASFADVSPEAWYAEAVAWASETGVAVGYGDGRFGPEDAITREQLAALLYRCAGLFGLDTGKSRDLSDYTDSGEVSDWALTAASWATAEGLLRGTALAPKGGLSRAETASLLIVFVGIYDL
ncbi:MAG: S-layer homology domain-containing protein [Clostridiales bacterium]|jgi:hypothetical protein|nr:S-layer homology domain-containing protein [Clostridiales bacterium]